MNQQQITKVFALAKSYVHPDGYSENQDTAILDWLTDLETDAINAKKPWIDALIGFMTALQKARIIELEDLCELEAMIHDKKP